MNPGRSRMPSTYTAFLAQVEFDDRSSVQLPQSGLTTPVASPSMRAFCPGLRTCRFDRSSILIDNPRFRSEGFPSGQRDQTVNLTALPSKVRILPPPPKTTRNGTGGDGVKVGLSGILFVYLVHIQAGVAQW